MDISRLMSIGSYQELYSKDGGMVKIQSTRSFAVEVNTFGIIQLLEAFKHYNHRHQRYFRTICSCR